MCHPVWGIYSFPMKNDNCPTSVYEGMGCGWESIRHSWNGLRDTFLETSISHKMQMKKTLDFNEITALPHYFKTLQNPLKIGIWYLKGQ